MSELHMPYPRKAGFKSWLVVLTSALFFFYEFIQMNSFNAFGAQLQQLYGLNATQLGDLAAKYFYADVIFLFPAGIILDRISVKRLILIAMTVCVLSTLGFAMSHTLYWAKIFRFFEGIGAAFILLSSLKLASRWFPLSQLALVTGVVVTMAMLGGVLAQTPLTILVEQYGWRNALYVDVALGVFVMFVIALIVQDYPPQQLNEIHEEDEALDKLGFWHSIAMALKNGQNWLCGTYTSLMNLPVMIFGVVWGSLYLKQTHALSVRDASWIVSMIFYGMVVGSPLIGWLSDYLQERRKIMIIGALLSLVNMGIIITANVLNFSELMILFFLLGILSSTQVLSYPLITENNPHYLTSTAMGFSAVIIMGGGALFEPLFGFVMDYVAPINHAVGMYPAMAYQKAALLLPFSFAAALLVCFFIKDHRCHSVDEEMKFDSLDLSKNSL